MDSRQKISNRIALLKTDVDFLQKILDALPPDPELANGVTAIAGEFKTLQAKLAKDAKEMDSKALLKECDDLHAKITLRYQDIPKILSQINPDEEKRVIDTLKQATTNPAAIAQSDKDDKSFDEYRKSIDVLRQKRDLYPKVRERVESFNRFITERDSTYKKLHQAEEQNVTYQLEKDLGSNAADLKPHTIYVKVSSHFNKKALHCRLLDPKLKMQQWDIAHYDYQGSKRVDNEFKKIIEQFEQSKEDPKAIEANLPAILKKLARYEFVLLPEVIIDNYTTKSNYQSGWVKDALPAVTDSDSVDAACKTVNATLEKLPATGIVYSAPRSTMTGGWGLYPEPTVNPLVFGFRKQGWALDYNDHEVIGIGVSFNDVKLQSQPGHSYPDDTPDFTINGSIHPYQFLFKLKINNMKPAKDRIVVQEINPLYLPLFKSLFTPEVDCKAVANEINQLLQKHSTTTGKVAAYEKANAAAPAGFFNARRIMEVKGGDLPTIRNELLAIADKAKNEDKTFINCIAQVLQCHPALELNNSMGQRVNNFLHAQQANTAGANAAAGAGAGKAK